MNLSHSILHQQLVHSPSLYVEDRRLGRFGSNRPSSTHTNLALTFLPKASTIRKGWRRVMTRRHLHGRYTN
jgi:hypothetical protein